MKFLLHPPGMYREPKVYKTKKALLTALEKRIDEEIKNQQEFDAWELEYDPNYKPSNDFEFHVEYCTSSDF